MKLANLSICLVLAFVLGGCFNGTNSPNSVAQEQEALQTQDLELLQNLQSIDLNKAFDSKGALANMAKPNLTSLKKSQMINLSSCLSIKSSQKLCKICKMVLES